MQNEILQAKYPHLEVSVLKLSEVKKDNEIFRIDSEPFKKSNLYINSNLQYEILKNIAIINPSKTEIVDVSKTTKITFLSMQNLGNGIINERESGIINDFKSGYTYFAENDILIAKITPCMEHGKCAIATNLENKIGFGSTEFNVFRVCDNRFLQEYIFCFLNRESIRKIAADNMVGTSGRQRVPSKFYENLKIPILPMEFQLEIEKMVKESHESLEKSKALYKEAQNLLNAELGLDDAIIKDKNTLNTRILSLKESFLKTGRLDAEYYELKYEKIESLIKNYKGGFIRLKDIGIFTNGSFIEEKFYTKSAKRAYIRIKELSLNSPIRIQDCIYIDDYFKDNNETKVLENDFVIATIGNTIGKVNLIPKELDGSFISNNTSKFKLLDENVLPKFLELLLRSFIVQEQIQREFTQTAQPKISNVSLENILIPKISKEIQEEIALNLQKSFDLRKDAKELLESAKSKVESAIIGGGRRSFLKLWLRLKRN